MTKQNKQITFCVLLGAITISGFLLRLVFCFWGFPYQFHPDEHTIVDSAIDMLSRHSWEAFVYNRPDHFEIKSNAIIFTIYSWIKYGMPAYEAFEMHKGAFYFVARLFTTVFGTAMIPMMSVMVGKILNPDKIRTKYVQIVTAMLVAFSPIFIEHSAYATPDIVLTFFVVLIGCLSVNYLNTGSKKQIYLITILTGICITIKYPAAIMCSYIAFIVIYKCIKKKGGISEIVHIGLNCIVILFLTMFFLAPNLFTDVLNVITTFIIEARPNHLGQDGRGFLGNLAFYFTTIAGNFGYISIIFFVAGLVFIYKNRNEKYFCLLISGIYWPSLSMLSLYWVRWGIPMYISFIIVVAIGIGFLFDGVTLYCKDRKIFKSIPIILTGIMLGNTVISAIRITKWSTIQDTRVTSLEFCLKNNITEENSIYEGYTPLSMDSWPGAAFNAFEIEDGELKVKEKNAAKEYFVLSDSYRKRYRKEADFYPEEASIYNALDQTYELIYFVNAETYQSSPYELQNMLWGIKYIWGNNALTGNTIYIYDLEPDYITIRLYDQDEQYVSLEDGEGNDATRLSKEPYTWALYEANQKFSFISKQTERVLSVADTNSLNGSDAVGDYISDEKEHYWSIQENDGYCYLLFGDDMALTCEKERVFLRPFIQSDQQKWVLEKIDN